MTSIPELEETHKYIHNKLDVFIKNRKIPNIIFYGPHGSGKTHILNRFIHAVYNGDKVAMKRDTLYPRRIKVFRKDEY
jgi:DNA replication protein DnaC